VWSAVYAGSGYQQVAQLIANLFGETGSIYPTAKLITPSPIHRGDGVLFSMDFFVCLFVYLCFFVSKITRKRRDRFA